MFIAYLAYYRRLSYKGIRINIYGVRDWKNMEDPTAATGKAQYKYKRLMSGIKRAAASRMHLRKPLNKQHLKKLIKCLKIFPHATRSMF